LRGRSSSTPVHIAEQIEEKARRHGLSPRSTVLHQPCFSAFDREEWVVYPPDWTGEMWTPEADRRWRALEVQHANEESKKKLVKLNRRRGGRVSLLRAYEELLLARGEAGVFGVLHVEVQPVALST